MTTSSPEGTRVVGSLRSAEGRGVVRIQDTYDTDVEDLWSALTEPSRLARWLGEVEGDLRPGGDLRARFASTWEGPGRVDVCEPPRRLLVTASPGEDDETVIEAWLSANGERTVLVIEQRGLPLEELAGRGAGWQAHVENLADYLAGREVGDWRDRRLELTPAYQDLAGSPLWQAERASLMNFLQAQRRSVLAILDGLGDEALRKVVVPSGWTPLGIVEHLAYAERFWFQQVLTGQARRPGRTQSTPLLLSTPRMRSSPSTAHSARSLMRCWPSRLSWRRPRAQYLPGARSARKSTPRETSSST